MANANRNRAPATQRRFLNNFSTLFLLAIPDARPNSEIRVLDGARPSSSAAGPVLNGAPSRRVCPSLEPRRMGGVQFDGRCEPTPNASSTQLYASSDASTTTEEDERRECLLEGHEPCLLRRCAERGRAVPSGTVHFGPDKTLSVSKRRLRSDGSLCAIISPRPRSCIPRYGRPIYSCHRPRRARASRTWPACGPRVNARCFLSTCDSDKRRRLALVYNRKVRTCNAGSGR